MTDPSIALQVRQPEAANPLATIGALQNLKNAQVENALRSQQIDASRTQQADVQAQADQRNLDLKDQNTIQQLMQDPTVAKAIGAGDLSALNGKVQPKSVAGLQTQVLAQQQQIATKNKADLDLHTEQLGQIATGLAGLKLIAKDRPGDLPGAYAQWRNTVIGAKIVGPETLPAQITSANDLDNIGGVTGAFLGMHEKVQADSAAAQKIKTDASTEALNTAHAGEFAAQADELRQAKANALATLPKLQAEAKVAELDAAFKAAHGGRGAEDLAKDTEAARHNKADEANAAGHLAITRKTFDATFGPNAVNQGLIGVQPHLVGPATAAVLKAGEEYASAAQVRDSMKTMLDMAAKGNKAAGSNLPLIGVETLNAINGIKRINGAEIAQYGSAGSLLDHIQGKIGKLVSGQPIPQDVLDDIRALHTELDKGAKEKYANKVQLINKTFNSKFKAEEFGAGGDSAADLNTRLANAKEGDIIPLGNGHSVKKVAGGYEQQ